MDNSSMRLETYLTGLETYRDLKLIGPDWRIMNLGWETWRATTA
jgi:hypothetical protein